MSAASVLRPWGDKMKIYFCDVCNESIPIQDIKDGMATTIDGKIYCKEHNPLRAFEGVSAKKAPDKLQVAMLVLVIILLGAILVVMIMDKSGDEEPYVLVKDFSKLEDDLDDLDRKFVDFTAKYEVMETRTIEKESQIPQMQTDINQLRVEQADIRTRMGNLGENLKEASNVKDQVVALELDQKAFKNRLADVDERFAAQEQKLLDLEDSIVQLASAGPAVSPGTGASDSTSTPTGPEPDSDELVLLKKQLASKDAAERFDAVNQVLDRRIKKALPFVVPLIEDSDLFIQIGAIQTVAEFLYLDALPALVKALRDNEALVRDEALLQLIRMTGETSLEFDPRGSKSEREKSIKKWEEWLKKNGY